VSAAESTTGASGRLVDSYYEASVERKPFGPPLEGAAEADVCVVGGGFTGISAALNLAEKGLKVVVLEANKVGWGASGRNGGQFSPGYSSHSLEKICREIPGVSPKDLWDLSAEAVDILKERVERHSIDCDLQLGHLLVAVRERHLAELDAHCRELGGYGREIERLDRAAVRETVASDRYLGGALDMLSGHIHPLKYALGLAGAACEAGAEIREDTRVTGVASDGKGGRRVIVPGGEVRCRHVVLACNAYLEELEPDMRSRVMPVGTYICATRPLGRERAQALIANRACVVDMNFVLDYYRLSADDRLLFGGRASYSTLQPGDMYGPMRRRMCKVFPQLASEDIDHVWGGYVAITPSRFPDFGRAGEGVYYAQGFSGHGVALTGLAGKLLAEAIAGDPSRFDRIAAFKSAAFPGGRALRTPLLVLAMAWYKLRDLL